LTVVSSREKLLQERIKKPESLQSVFGEKGSYLEKRRQMGKVVYVEGRTEMVRTNKIMTGFWNEIK
jgi:hypothetical protein